MQKTLQIIFKYKLPCMFRWLFAIFRKTTTRSYLHNHQDKTMHKYKQQHYRHRSVNIMVLTHPELKTVNISSFTLYVDRSVQTNISCTHYTHKYIHITWLIPELRNTAHSCSQHGPATPWLTSEWPRNVIHSPKISTLMEEHCLS